MMVYKNRRAPFLILLLMPLAAHPSAAQTLANGDFETIEPVGGALPNVIEDWDGDTATIVSAENGISPASGTGMLRFDGTFFIGASFDDGSEIYQLVDVSSLAGAIASGTATATFSASFNRVDTSVDSLFRIFLRAYSGDPSGFDADSPDLTPHLQLAQAVISSDPFPASWNEGSVEMLLPVGTTYLAVSIVAQENSVNNSTAPEFAGHYADAVGLTITGGPAAPVPTLNFWGWIALVVLLGSVTACRPLTGPMRLIRSLLVR